MEISDRILRLKHARRVLDELRKQGDWGKCYDSRDLEQALLNLKKEAVLVDRLAGFLAGTYGKTDCPNYVEMAKTIIDYQIKAGLIDINCVNASDYVFSQIQTP
jgi:hypothetical protein